MITRQTFFAAALGMGFFVNGCMTAPPSTAVRTQPAARVATNFRATPPRLVSARPAAAAVPANPVAANQGANNQHADNPWAAMAPASVDQSDPNVPLILPESADQLPPAQMASATSTPRAATVMPSDASPDELELALLKRARENPRDASAQLDYQLLRFCRGEQTPDMSAVAGLSPEDRDIVCAMMDGLDGFRATTQSNDNLLFSRKIKPIQEMADRLAARADLTIPTVALCTRVDSYGVYKPVDSTRFAAGVDHPVIVYCEVDNFTTKFNDQKMWETRLTQQTVLYTETGMPVWPEKKNPQTFVDQSRNRRHDFFVARVIHLPANLTIGNYLLKISLVDQQSNHVAEATTPIQIVADGKD